MHVAKEVTLADDGDVQHRREKGVDSQPGTVAQTPCGVQIAK